ncbi:MAG: acetyltransferase [Alphaproteobacteria bacterium]|nr:acetyltransferase [Alphaproteobacteria bacterium]
MAVKKIVVWGASGHAKVLRPIIEGKGLRIVALIDQNKDMESFIPGCPIFPALEELPPEETKNAFFAIAVGGDKGRERLHIHERLCARGLSPVTLVHGAAWVAASARLEDGAQVLGMAAVSEEARIGMHSIVNTNASVDHECLIGQGCHIMPGATLAGCVEVGDFATIGSNATILPRIRIGRGAVIGAGAVVTRDVAENVKVVGVPAAPVR